jgi:uncharacterized membrane protein HdeD (DUF308 family)
MIGVRAGSECPRRCWSRAAIQGGRVMSEADFASRRYHVSRAVGKLWWLPLVRGILLIILGGYALFRPGMSMLLLTQLLGIYLVFEGILAIMAALMGETASRWWTILRGALAILAGIFAFGHPALVAGLTATFVLYLIAIFAIVLGVLEIIGAVQDRQEIEGEGWLILGGVLAIGFGVLLLIAPMAFGLMFVRVLGAFAILYGISLISLALRVRGFGKALAH